MGELKLDKLNRYAESYAYSRLGSSPSEAVDLAMDNLTDWIMSGKPAKYQMAYAKTTIRNAINRWLRNNKQKSRKLIRVTIDKITSPSEKQVISLYMLGYRQVEIAKKRKVSEPYVSKIMKKWTFGENEDDKKRQSIKGKKRQKMNGIKVFYLECLRCGHKWLPRRPVAPKACPKCNSPYWNKPRKYKRKGDIK